MIGYGSFECLGHIIEGQSIRPKEDKAIRDAVIPTTKNHS